MILKTWLNNDYFIKPNKKKSFFFLNSVDRMHVNKIESGKLLKNTIIKYVNKKKTDIVRPAMQSTI